MTFGFTSAQNLKFGHTNSQEIMTLMPDTKLAQDELEKLAKTHTERFNAMKAEYEKKYTEYVENSQLKKESPEKWDDLTIADKESELQNLQQRLQNYEGLAQQKIAEKQNELLKPITDKITEAIKNVAVEGKFIYIFDISTLLYFSPDQSVDITPLVKKKLGIQ
jgi:outer membrane protein